jgi:uncharacterized protein YecE (DUF72 family)
LPADRAVASALAERRLRVGLSGWSYPGWRDGFYDGVPRRRWLAHSASHFNGLEANATFYGGQKPETYARWRDETPDGFAFAVKGHRMVTHLKRLSDPAESIARQRRSLQPLAAKLSAVLWQLPESFRRDDRRLDGLLDGLGKEWPKMRHAIEFRHPSWFADEVAGRLQGAGVATCLSDSPRWPMWDAVTGGLAYVRLHGHSRLYRSRYAKASLDAWARRVRGWLREGCEVHVYFDNDAEGHAPWDALRLKGLLGAS